MQIRHYDEVDPLEVYRLTMTAFGWRLTPEAVRHALRTDPATIPGYAFYASEAGRVVAQVLPLLLDVRMTTGVERIGGVAGVCPLPAVWGRGYARRLMHHTHRFFKDEGLALAALTTSRNIRGHPIYRRMGYVGLAEFLLAVRAIPERGHPPTGVTFRKVGMKDIPRLQEFYKDYVKGHFGWTERDPRRLRSAAAWDQRLLDRYRLVVRRGRPVGYVHRSSGGWERGEEQVVSEETVVPRREAFPPLMMPPQGRRHPLPSDEGSFLRSGALPVKISVTLRNSRGRGWSG